MTPLAPGGTPPVAARRPVSRTWHGETLVDDYAWLREKESAEVRAYLEAENAYADAVLAPTVPLQERLYTEMLARIKETDLSVPYPDAGWLWYSRTEQGKQYPIHCRKRTEDAPEEVVLDVNALAEGKPFMSLGAYAPNDDATLLAYSTDETGFRTYTLRVKDLRTGALLPDVLEKVVSVAWAADGRTLFYTVEDDAKRPARLYRHVLGTPASDDPLLFDETDERFRLYVGRTRSRAMLMVISASPTTSEWRWLPADDPHAPMRLVAPRVADREYDVEHAPDASGDWFLIRVNDTGRNFRLVRAPVASPDAPSWEEVLPHRDDTMLEGVDVFAHHWIAYERRNGLEEMRVRDRATGDEHLIAFPEPAYEAGPGANRLWDTTTFRFTYQSLVTPSSVFAYDLRTRTRTLLKQQEVLGGYDAGAYRSERFHATAPDGTAIPISIVYRADRARDGRGPLLLTGYGAYGIPYTATFSSTRLSLLDRGVAVAIAHIRGGGDLGKPWHDAGRMEFKENTFRDFIACADHLVAEGWAAREGLVIDGGSAGGLLIGAVLNARPDLCKAAMLHVPFVDVLNTMGDPTLPLTVPEYEEWGNPEDPAYYAVMRRYCPYTNLRATAYPWLLVRTSLNDSQVMYWEPAKYVAKLRTLKTDANPLLLTTNMGAGHGGASGRYDRLREIALDYAFVLAAAGLDGA